MPISSHDELLQSIGLFKSYRSCWVHCFACLTANLVGTRILPPPHPLDRSWSRAEAIPLWRVRLRRSSSWHL